MEIQIFVNKKQVIWFAWPYAGMICGKVGSGKN